jgi:hypothetical protein
MNTARFQNGTVGRFFNRFHSWFNCLVVLSFALTLTSCSSVRLPGSVPKAQVTAAQLSAASSGPVTASVLQAQVMRFADTYVALISQACDDISAETTNTDCRIAALRWKLQQGTAAYNDATGDNPSMNALDMLVLATMAQNVIEDYGLPTYGKKVHPLLDAQTTMESNAWNMAESILTPAQQKELRTLISQWRQKNPNQTDIGPVRFREFAAALGQTPKQSGVVPTSIFSLLYLNPLSGLDPTTAAIEGIRELGERTVYYSQRMPQLLSWQTQLLVYQLAGQPQSVQILADLNHLSASSAIFAQTAQQLPQLINDQRQAAIQQILDGIVAQENKSTELLTNTRLTLDSMAVAATNINTAIQSLTTFVEYVSPTNSTPETTSTNNSPPFNVLDYGKAATQIGAAANHLQELLATVNQTTPQMQKISDQMTANADHVVHHAFVMGLILIIVLLAGSVIAALVYRILVNKMAGGSKPPEQKT